MCVGLHLFDVGLCVSYSLPCVSTETTSIDKLIISADATNQIASLQLIELY